MTVSLIKDPSLLRWAQVRTLDNGAFYDLAAWQDHIAPLWWDDASYARYQADDGAQGYWRHELGFRPGDAPIVAQFVWYDELINPDTYEPLPVELVSPSRTQRIEDEARWAAMEAEREAARIAEFDEVPF